MTTEELCKLAQNNEPMPCGLWISEQILFSAVRNIYAAYRAGTITAEQGKNEKNLALGQYENIRLWEKIFHEQHKRSVELGKLLTKANKEGCEVCRQMAGLIDGRITIYENEIDFKKEEQDVQSYKC